MNFLAHGLLAMEHLACPVGALASMAEDLAPLAGLRLVRSGASAEARLGLEHHRRIDATFHDAPEFKASCTQVARVLKDAGEDRWAAVATAHVVVELLIDGSIPAGEASALWATALSAPVVQQSAALFSDTDQNRWFSATQAWHRAGPPRYDSVAEVARRSVGAVARRGRLRSLLSHEEVARSLIAVAPSVRSWPDWRAALAPPTLCL